jgi:hypothetical protein
VVAVRLAFVLRLVAVTMTPETAAPVLSVTTPVICPVSCACAKGTTAKTMMNAALTQNVSLLRRPLPNALLINISILVSPDPGIELVMEWAKQFKLHSQKPAKRGQVLI